MHPLEHDAGGAHLAGWLLTGLLVLAPAVPYLRAVRARRARGRRWPRWRAACFLVGLVLVATAVSPPLHRPGPDDPVGHMVQHLLLGMFAPLALVLAAPVTLLLGPLSPTHRRAAAGLLRNRLLHGVAHPATAAALHVGALYLLYLTPLYAATAGSPPLHLVVNAHFLLAGLLFTWSIAGPDPAPHRPRTAVRVAVLVVAGGAHAFLAKLLYARASELPPGSGHEPDSMRAAAQLMYYGGDVAELALAVALFAAWYRASRPSRVRVPGAG